VVVAAERPREGGRRLALLLFAESSTPRERNREGNGRKKKM
jgi:hypothetical protein